MVYAKGQEIILIVDMEINCRNELVLMVMWTCAQNLRTHKGMLLVMLREHNYQSAQVILVKCRCLNDKQIFSVIEIYYSVNFNISSLLSTRNNDDDNNLHYHDNS